MSEVYGVWFQGRNTPVVVSATSRSEAVKKARRPVSGQGGRRHKAAGHDQPVKSVQQLKGQDLKEARAGRWVRSRAKTGGGTQRVTGRAPEGKPPKYRPGLG